MDCRRLTDTIGYYPAREQPLSAEVAVIAGDSGWWIFDAGAAEDVAAVVRALPGEKRLLISHFHQDHMACWEQMQCGEIYAAPHTLRYTGRGTAVRSPLILRDGADLRLFPLPSSHARGCLGLETEGFAFLGDGLYACVKQGRWAYNTSVLAETLRTLRNLQADRLLLSHDFGRVRARGEVVAELEAVYARRQPGEPYIFLEAE
ncbi:MAG: hypothetical protein ACI4O7_01410 [Aristaeellaceae bacterium]